MNNCIDSINAFLFFVCLAIGNPSSAYSSALSILPCARKDYENAFNYLKEAKAIEDSIVSKSNSVQYAQLRSLMATETKEREIEFLRKEQEWTLFRQKITYAGLGLALFDGGIVIYYQRKNIRDKKQLLEKKQPDKRSTASAVESRIGEQTTF